MTTHTNTATSIDLDSAAAALREARARLDYVQARQAGSNKHVEAAHTYQGAVVKLVGAALATEQTATGTGATHEQLSTNPDTLSTNQAGLSGNLDAGTGDADERALFEHSERASNLKRDSEGDYENPCVQSAWEGWQARAALAKQAAAPAEQSGGDSEREFIVVDDDLQAFLDAAVDWVRGKPQNMDTGLYMFDLLQRLEDRLAGNTAPVVDDAGAQAAAQPDTSKAIYWFSVLTKCARLLNLDTETPIPSGVLAAVEKLTTTPATAQDDARNAAQSDNALARMERAEWSAVSNALRDARAHLCKDGVRHTWLDGAVTLAEERAKGRGTYADRAAATSAGGRRAVPLDRETMWKIYGIVKGAGHHELAGTISDAISAEMDAYLARHQPCLDEAAAYRFWRDRMLAEDASFVDAIQKSLPGCGPDTPPTAAEWDAAIAAVMRDRAAAKGTAGQDGAA